MSNNPVTYNLTDNIGVIRVNNPPVNALSQAVRQGLSEALAAAAQDAAAEAVLLCCEGRTFIAGADITEFGKPPQPPHLPEVLAAIEDSPKPVIAVLHGTALGGGFEVALACHYRCAVASARVGLPEVHLGLLPGAGGTQRVPRLAGVEAALDMIIGGRPVAADKALELGLVDEVFKDHGLGELQVAAMEYAKGLAADKAPLRRVRDINIDPASVEAGLFDEQRRKSARRARGQIAPERIIRCVEAAATRPFDEGIKVERELFTELLQSPESAAMRHIFFAERQAAKIKDLPKSVKPRPVGRVAVIGGGTMGGGIAMCFANAGIPVDLLEVSDEALARGMKVIRGNYEVSQRKGRMSAEQLEYRMNHISGTTDYADLDEADLVIEAVFEDLELKKQVFAKLDAACRPGCILATNTSYQDVDAIAAATSRPQDVLGMHFFSPANVMRLLEVVRGARSADDVLATAMAVGRRIGKVCALARVCYGFIGNRMLGGYGRESQRLLLDGCTPAQVDAALESFGMAMGPLAMGDLAGLDVGYKARQSRGDSMDDPAYRVSTQLVEMGRLGQKSGAGYYKYDAATRARQDDPEVEALIKEEAAKLKIKQRQFGTEEIIERCLYPLINEGAKVLQEGIAQRAADIDVVYVYGYAFPAAKGGPMFYADQVGLAKLHERIRHFYDESGGESGGESHWQPAPLLEELAKSGGSFAGWDKQR